MKTAEEWEEDQFENQFDNPTRQEEIDRIRSIQRDAWEAGAEAMREKCRTVIDVHNFYHPHNGQFEESLPPFPEAGHE